MQPAEQPGAGAGDRTQTRVLLSPFAVKAVSWSDRQVVLDITRAQVKGSPPWEPATIIDRAYEGRLHGYYGWPGYGW